MDRSHQDPSMIVNCKNQSGFTPLHYASENGHFSIVQCLLRYTMDKNPKNEWGTTPLHYAAVEGTRYLKQSFFLTSIMEPQLLRQKVHQKISVIKTNTYL